MNFIGQLFEFIQKLIVWWVSIMPWEEGVFIRGGKSIRIVRAGIHLRIPFYDQVYIQTTRLRVTQGPPQTVTTADGKALTIVACVGYAITDIRKVYMNLFNAEVTLVNMMQGIIADEVSRRSLTECHPSQLEKAIGEQMGKAGEEYGLKFGYTKITGFAVVKAIRLIQDFHYMPNDLRTDQAKA